ncbi:hypothetical protein [Solicola sp. PLA-1-18]|uniref:hypothetical protein n=1 Tax=Solicola sp. PLA-1-18 TaxID=3380532 RepID=UPI003B760B11
MHGANHYYGHAHVMARYAGLPRPFMIWGYLQHGWNILDGFAVGTRFVPGPELFVWSDTVVRRGWSMGMRRYKAIGAAWLYLLEVADEPPADQERAGTIFYPFHGWEGQEVLGDHQRMADEVREVEGDVPLTACLYWNEHEDPRIRQVYERSGFRVICHGQRGFNYQGTTTRFLDGQLAELRRHRRVVSNRLSSAVLYGASVGCSTGVYGDPMVLENEHPSFGGTARLARLWPEMHQPFVPDSDAFAFAAEELGTRHLAGPEEIRDLFRWPDPASLVRAADATTTTRRARA